jgi:hypothetical protein
MCSHRRGSVASICWIGTPTTALIIKASHSTTTRKSQRYTPPEIYVTDQKKSKIHTTRDLCDSGRLSHSKKRARTIARRNDERYRDTTTRSNQEGEGSAPLGGLLNILEKDASSNFAFLVDIGWMP